MTPLAYLLIILFCILLSGFFSSSETALLRIRREDLDKDIESNKSLNALAVRDLLSSTSRLLVTILLGNNVVNILGASCASALAIFYLGPEKGIIVSTVLMTIIVLVFSEIVPKAVAARNPKNVSYRFALPLYILHKMLLPIHFMMDRLMDPVVRRISGKKDSTEHSAAVTSEEVLRLAKQARDSGGHGTPMPIIKAAAEASERTVAEIMVQRTEVVAFPVDVSPSSLLDQMMEERFTRVPIYQENLDNVLGVVHLKDLVAMIRTKNSDIKQILKPVLRVPEKKPVLSLLKDMQRAFIHLAIVKDEFGTTQGIVTQEDVLEEIVGEIRDEFDEDELLEVQLLTDGNYRALGHTSILDFNRKTGWQIKAEKGETLSGLVFNALGRSPRVGDQIQIQEFAFRVIDVSGGRITQLRIGQSEDPKHLKAVE